MKHPPMPCGSGPPKKCPNSNRNHCPLWPGIRKWGPHLREIDQTEAWEGPRLGSSINSLISTSMEAHC